MFSYCMIDQDIKRANMENKVVILSKPTLNHLE